MLSNRIFDLQVDKRPAKRKPKRKKLGVSAKVILEAELKQITTYVEEYKFHDKRKWRLDYYIPELKIAIELHGGVYTNGRHTRGTGFTEDRVKMNEAQIMGIMVLEVTSEQVESGKAIELIKRAIIARGMKDA
jgi:hypothetical protein